MNREEEIIETARFIYEPCIPQSLQMRLGFIDGAKWADKTMIDKAYKWLEKNRNELSRVDTSGFVELFKKAMEE